METHLDYGLRTIGRTHELHWNSKSTAPQSLSKPSAKISTSTANKNPLSTTPTSSSGHQSFSKLVRRPHGLSLGFCRSRSLCCQLPFAFAATASYSINDVKLSANHDSLPRRRPLKAACIVLHCTSPASLFMFFRV